MKWAAIDKLLKNTYASEEHTLDISEKIKMQNSIFL